MADGDIAEKYFWSCLVVFIVIFTGAGYYITSNAERERMVCVKACGVYTHKFIGEVCHCKIDGGWREALPPQVMEDL